MKALFIANLDLVETEGIYKKVCAQAEAIGEAVGNCDMITRSGHNANVKKQGEAHSIKSDQKFLDYVETEFENKEVGFAYIRHMIPGCKLIHVLKTAKKNGIKVYYEIPTYPYFAEQFRSSRRKYRAVAKIMLDVIFWPFIYKYIDKLVVIRSNTKAKTYPKMVEITNGVRTDGIKSKDYTAAHDDNCFRMVAVGTLYPYHGYDRVLKGLAACGEKVGDITVEFHVIGSSQTIDDLHKQADSLGLKHIIFHGTKTTEELNEMYDSFDVGLGCIALHRRNADIDTTLKIIEYYCRGVPVITSGKSPMNDKKYSYVVPDNESPIDIESIYNYYNEIDSKDLCMLAEKAKAQFSWSNIMKNLLEGLL
jgi:glycosyltransferase involved in cell wall biosynthesis